MERVARRARHRALANAIVVARRAHETVELAARHARQVVVPKRVREELRVLLQFGAQLRRIAIFERDDELALLQLLPRTERRALFAPAIEVLALHDRHRVALAARLGVARRVHAQRMFHRLVEGILVGAQRMPAQRVAVGFAVGLAWAVARLACDAQLGGHRVDATRVDARHRMRRVASVAVLVPRAVRRRRAPLGRHQEHGGERQPALFFDAIDHRHDAEFALVAGRVPQRLRVVRSSHLHDGAFDAFAASALVERDPKLVAAPAQRDGIAKAVEVERVELRKHRLPRRGLRHRAVVGMRPTRVFAGMARTACAGADIAVLRSLDRAIGRLAAFGGHKRRREHERRQRSRRDDCDRRATLAALREQ